MRLHLLDCDRAHLLRNESGQAFVQTHAQGANALRPQTQRGREHQVGAVRLQQVGRTDIRMKTAGDQRHHVHQRFGGLAALVY